MGSLIRVVVSLSSVLCFWAAVGLVAYVGKNVYYQSFKRLLHKSKDNAYEKVHKHEVDIANSPDAEPDRPYKAHFISSSDMRLIGRLN